LSSKYLVLADDNFLHFLVFHKQFLEFLIELLQNSLVLKNYIVFLLINHALDTVWLLLIGSMLTQLNRLIQRISSVSSLVRCSLIEL